MKIKPTNAHKHFTVSYKHNKLPTHTYLGHNCGYPVWEESYKVYIVKAFLNVKLLNILELCIGS
jgi:hypothetical protein